MASNINPLSMRLATSSGKMVHGDFICSGPFTAGDIVAEIVRDPDGSADFVLQDFVSHGMQRVRLTDEEFEQLPLHLRDEEHRFSVEFVQIDSVGEGQPLNVTGARIVKGNIGCRASDLAPSTHRATLRISGGPKNADMPITFVSSEPEFRFEAPLVAHQHQTVMLPVTIALPGAPDTEVEVDISGGAVHARPLRIIVPQGGSATARLILYASPNAPLGPFQAHLWIKGHTQVFDPIPVTIDVQPPLPAPEVDKRVIIDEIHRTWAGTGGLAGAYGVPISEVQFKDSWARRTYRGGEIHVFSRVDVTGEPVILVEQFVSLKTVLKYLGLRCIKESNHDGGSDKDEPYVVIVITSLDGLPTTRRFEYGSIETGTERKEAIFLKAPEPANPFALQVLMYEHDHGSTQSTADKIQEEAVKLAGEISSIASASAAGAADGPGMGVAAGASAAVGLISGPIGALAAGIAVNVLGLADDFIGQDARFFFDKAGKPEMPAVLGQFRGDDFNVVFPIRGGGEGDYDLFFYIEVQKLPIVFPERF